MTPDMPLQDASTGDLIAAVEENLFGLFRAMAAVLPDGELIENDGLSCHLTFPHNPMFIGAWRTRLAPEEVDAAIDETIAWFEARNTPFMFWWIGPSTELRPGRTAGGARLDLDGRAAEATCTWHLTDRSWCSLHGG